jgi:hypothetical protein
MVLGGLLGAMTATSLLLMAVSPQPLVPDATSSLFAVPGNPESLDSVFDTRVAVQPGHWKSIYIHHSRTPSGSALSLAQPDRGMGDHFLIGNGDGCVDGEIQVGQRWDKQLSAAAPAGARGVGPDCISICLVGDFDRSVPTPVQMRRLTQLIGTLQSRMGISADHVMIIPKADSPAGLGQYFPTNVLHERLLP